MFTGIIQELGVVRDVTPRRLRIDAPGLCSQPAGNSIAVNGCCLTVVEVDGDTIDFDVLPETLAHTNLGDLECDDQVNLESAMRMGDHLGGHWVQGHVDAAGTVAGVSDASGALDVTVDLPPEVGRYCVERGSVTVNGVSLTVMELDREGRMARFQLIPETRSRTNLGALEPGDRVNLEADILARYVERLLPPINPSAT